MGMHLQNQGAEAFPDRCLGSEPLQSLHINPLCCSHECQGCKWKCPNFGEKTKSHCPALPPRGFPLKSEAEYMSVSQTLMLIVTRARRLGLVASTLLDSCVTLAMLIPGVWTHAGAWWDLQCPFLFLRSVTMCFFQPQECLSYKEEMEIVMKSSQWKKNLKDNLVIFPCRNSKTNT